MSAYTHHPTHGPTLTPPNPPALGPNPPPLAACPKPQTNPHRTRSSPGVQPSSPGVRIGLFSGARAAASRQFRCRSNAPQRARTARAPPNPPQTPADPRPTPTSPLPRTLYPLGRLFPTAATVSPARCALCMAVDKRKRVDHIRAFARAETKVIAQGTGALFVSERGGPMEYKESKEQEDALSSCRIK
eukprot:CAMPEP_0119369106 /NCGR_PEP_ID=MMETSP1334-20130426/15676_1 /TAXON_ID=127549 /ORGANISM="Calcidiscus leptoporus, Strain RCC1130" /LENGTH=187 /DNA_ID=CAMNT_0007385893 /DNA_START=8 /DNA_END=571 /DNA_ORIENTATION=+